MFSGDYIVFKFQFRLLAISSKFKQLLINLIMLALDIFVYFSTSVHIATNQWVFFKILAPYTVFDSY